MDHVQEEQSPARENIHKNGGGAWAGPKGTDREGHFDYVSASLGYLGGVSSQEHLDTTSLRTGQSLVKDRNHAWTSRRGVIAEAIRPYLIPYG